MNCEDFEKYIFGYLTDRNFDSKLKEAMEEHYFECDKCFNNLELTSATIGAIQTEGVDKLLKYSEEKNKISLKGKFRSLVDRLNQLVTDRFFPSTTLNLDGVRGGGKKTEIFKVGDPLIIQLDIPADMDGYLTILHYDEKNNLKMIFPKKKTDDTHVKAGEEKWIEMRANAPTGKHYLKAILTSNKIVEPNDINFSNSVDVVVTIEKLIDLINEITTDEWKESVTEFEVVKA